VVSSAFQPKDAVALEDTEVSVVEHVEPFRSAEDVVMEENEAEEFAEVSISEDVVMQEHEPSGDVVIQESSAPMAAINGADLGEPRGAHSDLTEDVVSKKAQPSQPVSSFGKDASGPTRKEQSTATTDPSPSDDVLQKIDKSDVAQEDPVPLKSTDEEDREFEVERIIGHKEKKSGLFYRVKWKGFDVSESTWEPEDNLLDCSELIDEYFSKKAQEQEKAHSTRTRSPRAPTSPKKTVIEETRQAEVPVQEKEPEIAETSASVPLETPAETLPQEQEADFEDAQESGPTSQAHYQKASEEEATSKVARSKEPAVESDAKKLDVKAQEEGEEPIYEVEDIVDVKKRRVCLSIYFVFINA
jgi:hypothetical protein